MSTDNLTAHKASEYDLRVKATIPFYDTIHSEVMRLAKVVNPAPERWLDTGCGTGRLVARALAEFPATRFWLADPAEAMLTEARLRLTGLATERVAILPATDSAGLRIHLSPGQFDVVTAIQCHHYLREEGRRKAVQACFEVLKPGGLFVTFENVAPRTEDGVRIGRQGWKVFLMEQGRTEAEAEAHLARYGTEFFPITAEQQLRMLDGVGFRAVELFWFSQMQAGFYGIK